MDKTFMAVMYTLQLTNCFNLIKYYKVKYNNKKI